MKIELSIGNLVEGLKCTMQKYLQKMLQAIESLVQAYLGGVLTAPIIVIL